MFWFAVICAAIGLASMGMALRNWMADPVAEILILEE